MFGVKVWGARDSTRISQCTARQGDVSSAVLCEQRSMPLAGAVRCRHQLRRQPAQDREGKPGCPAQLSRRIWNVQKHGA